MLAGYYRAVGLDALISGLTGAKPVPVPIREENGFAFSAEETLSLITPRTRLIIVNSPANPTGGVTPKSEVDKPIKNFGVEVVYFRCCWPRYTRNDYLTVRAVLVKPEHKG